MKQGHRGFSTGKSGHPELIATLVIVGIGIGVLSLANWRKAKSESLAIGSPAPVLGTALSGGDVKTGLEDYRGEVVLLDFWATYCTTCEVTVPALSRLQSKYGANGLHVVGVSIDAPSDTARARQLLSDLNANYALLFDRGKRLQVAYQLTLLPQSFLISRDGKIVWQQAGIVGGAKFPLELETPKGNALVEKVLAEQQAIR